MSRDPFAKALRVKPQQVIGDKRENVLREIWNEEIERGITDDERALLDHLEGAAAFEGARTGGLSISPTDSGPKGGGGSVSIPDADSEQEDSAPARSRTQTPETPGGSR